MISTTAGILAAWAFERYHIPFRNAWYLLIMLPLFMPGVVLGLGVAMPSAAFQIGGYGVYGSRELVMMAHSLWAMPLVFMLMEATFRTIDYRVVEASYDLGGKPVQTFFEIVIPMVSTGIISSALFAFVISLNEFVMALFLTDRDTPDAARADVAQPALGGNAAPGGGLRHSRAHRLRLPHPHHALVRPATAKGFTMKIKAIVATARGGPDVLEAAGCGPRMAARARTTCWSD